MCIRDSRKGKRLGRSDRLVQWTKGPRLPWMSRREFAALPDTMPIRMIRFQCEVAGWRTETVTIVTTLLDPQAYPARDLADLYRRRWEIETTWATSRPR